MQASNKYLKIQIRYQFKNKLALIYLHTTSINLKLITRVLGKKENPMDLENFILKTDLILKAILQTVKFLEAKGYTSIQMDLLKEELLQMVG